MGVKQRERACKFARLALTRYVEASRAPATQKAYAADWLRFSAWCQERATPALPASPAVVAVFLSALAARGLAPPSIARALAAIAHAHLRAGLVPTHRADGGGLVTDALAGIRWARTSDPGRKASPTPTSSCSCSGPSRATGSPHCATAP